MPLPPPSVDRTRKHVRRVELAGFKREDGYWDIEARITDVKDHDYFLSSGLRPQGSPVHDMSVRVTIDRHMTIVAAEACSDATPYAGYCDTIAPAYERVVGLNLFRGFRSAVKSLFGDLRGCSHLTELLMHLPTAALQTLASEVQDNAGGDSAHKPFQLDRCHALDAHGEAVRRYYPRWYLAPAASTGADPLPSSAPSSADGPLSAGPAGNLSNPSKESE
ncbi:DUF2889 domain-containing protein [Rhodocyclus tenuis]|uniref:DUF2889 domain-containing protein n=1 Tax=Rhodocyclus gracilis TaxID=2929842 RepID=UPI001298B98C|nr:DUF2889 domain-containing protein [Rhodocyclus gracilis]MRD73234.1 DUF2889 domain-containing protein [Rhodocyclus gracilis]